MKKITSIILALAMIFALLCLVSCGKEEKAANTLNTTPESLVKTLPEKLDLSDLDIIKNGDDNEIFFPINYSISDEDFESIDSFVATISHRSTDARAIAVIYFKDSADRADKIAHVKEGIENGFLKTIRSTTANYDPEQNKIATAANFRVYDNALVFVSYDADGNGAVYDVIEGNS